MVAVPELQLSSSWVDFGTCLVKQRQAREVCLMNLSGCRSYWAVLMGTRGRRALLLPPARPRPRGQHLPEGAATLSLQAGCRGWAPAARANAR